MVLVVVAVVVVVVVVVVFVVFVVVVAVVVVVLVVGGNPSPVRSAEQDFGLRHPPKVHCSDQEGLSERADMHAGKGGASFAQSVLVVVISILLPLRSPRQYKKEKRNEGNQGPVGVCIWPGASVLRLSAEPFGYGTFNHLC